MTEADYHDLSEEVSRTIEIVHGHVIKCESPTLQHNLIARRLSFALESARPRTGPCLRVETDEAASPNSLKEDLVDKKAQYAAAGIPLYLVVVLDDKYDIWEIREFHLDAAALNYRLHAVHSSALELEHPVRLALPITDLVTG
jgi:Uma2 family endonuclease